jgi:hypothetical protein
MQRSKQEDALMSQIANARQKLRDLESQLDELRIAQSGVKVGDIVVSGSERYQVLEVDPKSWGDVWVVGGKRKKDGTFGASRKSLFSNWEKEQA